MTAGDTLRPRSGGRRPFERWRDAAFSDAFLQRQLDVRVIRFICAHAWSGWWTAVSVTALVWTFMALDGGSVGAAAVALAVAVVASGAGVGLARFLLDKPLLTAWYATPVVILGAMFVSS